MERVINGNSYYLERIINGNSYSQKSVGEYFILFRYE